MIAATIVRLARGRVRLCSQEKFLRFALTTDVNNDGSVFDFKTSHADLACRERNLRRFVLRERRAVDHRKTAVRRARNAFERKVRW